VDTHGNINKHAAEYHHRPRVLRSNGLESLEENEPGNVNHQRTWPLNATAPATNEEAAQKGCNTKREPITLLKRFEPPKKPVLEE
jgi:hypothetical protein